MAAVAFAAGLPDGEVAGELTGLAGTAGLGDAGGLTGCASVHATIQIAAIPSRAIVTSLLIMLFFMILVRATKTVG